MKRRTFTQWISLGAIASSLPVAIAACQSTNDTAPSNSPAPSSSEASETIDSTPREDGFAAVGTVAKLDEQGFISDKAFFLGAVLVIRDPNNENAVLAVDSLCTHQGCSVAWAGDSGTFDCPCHGSKFNLDGTVAAGPATAPLQKFDAIIDGDLVLVKAAS
ncbi:MAG: Rieske (2Fe-2S) protein [Merismopedia sp. SIO2A8]|nr:Rieske (2Fe-2S) protein [Merismopedia sp. SIO2A8]